MGVVLATLVLAWTVIKRLRPSEKAAPEVRVPITIGLHELTNVHERNNLIAGGREAAPGRRCGGCDAFHDMEACTGQRCLHLYNGRQEILKVSRMCRASRVDSNGNTARDSHVRNLW